MLMYELMITAITSALLTSAMFLGYDYYKEKKKQQAYEKTVTTVLKVAQQAIPLLMNNNTNNLLSNIYNLLNNQNVSSQAVYKMPTNNFNGTWYDTPCIKCPTSPTVHRSDLKSLFTHCQKNPDNSEVYKPTESKCPFNSECPIDIII